MLPKDLKDKKIVFCVLDWGLGHASRSSVLIQQLLKQGNTLSIVSSGEALVYLKKEFSQVSYESIKSYNVKYFRFIPAWFSIVIQYFKISSAIKFEQNWMRSYCASHSVDIIISDSRYGCYHEAIPSVFISHQLNLLAPLAHQWVNKQYKKYFSHFNSVWIPDFEGKENLSGLLSHSLNNWEKDLTAKLQFIGPLSRLGFNTRLEKTIDYLFVLSGPEPARSLLENEVLAFSKYHKQKKIVLVRGTDKSITNKVSHTQLNIYNQLDAIALKTLLEKTKILISRSGYSSIMDYYQLPITKYLLPTHGQPEQEYLARYLDGRYGFIRIQSCNDIEKSTTHV
jgi:uncharacterized protein (TIGR00661 family)